VIDAIARQLPGALKRRRIRCAGFVRRGLLDYPHYTRPGNIRRDACPPVLCPATMRRSRGGGACQALGRTRDRRPELWEARTLTKDDSSCWPNTTIGRHKASATRLHQNKAGLGSRIGWRSAQQVFASRLPILRPLIPGTRIRGHPALRENGPPGTQICGDTHAHHRNDGAGRNCAPEQDDSRIRAGRTVIVNVNVVEASGSACRLTRASSSRSATADSFGVHRAQDFDGEGVERDVQTYSPLIASIEVSARATSVAPSCTTSAVVSGSRADSRKLAKPGYCQDGVDVGIARPRGSDRNTKSSGPGGPLCHVCKGKCRITGAGQTRRDLAFLKMSG